MYRSGTVTGFNDAKGFGFIKDQTDPALDNIFVHFSAIEGEGFKSLAEGDKVAYLVLKGPKGPQAVSVRRTERGAR